MIPVDLQGTGANAEILVPVDPELVSDFTDSETFTESEFIGVTGKYYVYDGEAPDSQFPHTFECAFVTDTFYVGKHVLFFGLWLGAYDWCNFIDENGTAYDSVSFDDIDAGSDDGSIRFNLIFSGSGQDAGGFVFYYNTTTYTDSEDAWDNDELYLIHGYGFTSNTDIVSLLVGILFLQLPDVPTGLNLLIATPPWASIVYIIWFIVKESIPFV